MKIGIDCDDVVSQFVKGFLNFYNLRFNKNWLFDDWINYNFWEVFGGTKEEAIKLIYDFYDSSDFGNLKLVGGVKEAIEKLSKNNSLFIITSRPLEFKEKTEKFLKKHFPEINFKLIFTSDFYKNNAKTKAEICEELGIEVYIEDNKDYAVECAKKGVKVFLFDKPWNKGEAGEVIRVKDWDEILENVKMKKTNSRGDLR